MKIHPIIESFGKLITIILTGTSLIVLPFDLIQRTHSNCIGIIFIVSFFSALTFIVLYYFIPPHILKRFGIKRYHSDAIIISYKLNVDIDDGYNAILTSEKEILFPKPPDDDELVDFIEVENNLDIGDQRFTTTDGIITKTIRYSKSKHVSYWQPQQKIYPNIPYIHGTKFYTPNEYGDEAFFQGHHVDNETGTVSYKFNCPRKVELAVAFTLPVLYFRLTFELLNKYTFLKKKRDCEQPFLSEDRQTVYWKLLNPKKNRTYICFVFYQDSLQTYMESIGLKYDRHLNYMPKSS